ncbi:hypothetical protein VB1_CDS0069 [Arthrobacter phage Marchesin]|nr:hypothetical protein VB1_CDS0069 [Arthrobacter phage Marchesin]
MVRAWLCRRGWHGWATTVWFDPAARRLRVHRSCVRPWCDVEEVQ